MIRYRNDAGDACRELSSAIMKIVPKTLCLKPCRRWVTLNWVIFSRYEKMLRNKHGGEKNSVNCGSSAKKKVADLVNEGFLTDYESLIRYHEIQYQKGTIKVLLMLDKILP